MAGSSPGDPHGIEDEPAPDQVTRPLACDLASLLCANFLTWEGRISASTFLICLTGLRIKQRSRYVQA